jgi:hypothetical protein
LIFKTDRQTLRFFKSEDSRCKTSLPDLHKFAALRRQICIRDEVLYFRCSSSIYHEVNLGRDAVNSGKSGEPILCQEVPQIKKIVILKFKKCWRILVWTKSMI